MTQTLTDQIFKLSAPYNNPHQGKDPRILFVCSAGLLRSATGANLLAKKGYNTRNCGTHVYALIPLSVNLIAWADHIIFVNKENHNKALTEFQDNPWLQTLTDKSIVLDVQDEYNYNHPELIKILEEQLEGKDLSRKSKYGLGTGYF